jgi:hypothetical protein
MTCQECWKYVVQCANCHRRFEPAETFTRSTSRFYIHIADYTEAMEVEDATRRNVTLPNNHNLEA